MCTFVIIGINHNDPLGRRKIRLILDELRISKNFIPDCIATEWDKVYFNIIQDQRTLFTKLAKEQNLNLKDETIFALADSMAYEADSHIELYPDLPIIWIDERFDGTIPDSVKRFAEYRLNVFLSFLEKLNKDEKDNLEAISRIAWSISSRGKAAERDVKFYNKLMNAVQNGYKNIIVIVGAAHATIENEGVLVNLLTKDNYTMQIYMSDKFGADTLYNI